MRRALWPSLIILVAVAAFFAGRVRSPHALPAMVATLPGDEAAFSHEFNERIRARFAIGSSEDALIDYLISENFAPDWRRRDGDNASVLVIDGLICQKTIRVNWRADAAGILTSVSGAYQSQCL